MPVESTTPADGGGAKGAATPDSSRRDPEGGRDRRPERNSRLPGRYRGTANVVSVQDGDTLTVVVPEGEGRVRIAGIDAPEKGQAFADRSRQNLSELVVGKAVHLDCRKRDPYKRAVCKVSLDGHDVGLRQIKDCMAWHFKKYAPEQPPAERETYTTAELAARDARCGLWSERDPVPPWDRRNRGKH